jgi:exonuclease SbcC
VFKLVSLRASGFKRLDLQEKLEFPDGRLLVHGRNESGKSTLMEAIHYALYGNPLKPSKNAGNEDIICYGRNDAVVELEFSIDDTQYQIRRELKRNKTNVHMLNKREQDGTLSRVTTGARNVNSEISVILHGIDSDALLNSCLVEQKELGKLEAANKQERIKAMSSLLNLEAFIDARDSLKKEASDLEKIHLQTLNKLSEAEKAKQEYEEAEKRLESAKKRLTVIIAEKKQVEALLEKLRRELEIIQQMKTHQTKINESKTKREGKQSELNVLRDQLEEIEKAEKELQTIEEKLPEAEKALIELEEKLKTVQRLSELQDSLGKIEFRLENIEVRLNENQRAYDEASEAKESVMGLSEEIEQYSPARDAAKKIDEISSLFNTLTSSLNEENRVEKELDTLRERLGDSKDSENRIKQLETQEKEANAAREKVQKLRTYGVAGLAAGLLTSVFSVFTSNLYLTALGVLILVSGGYIYATNNPGRFEDGLHQIRDQREKMLGERARIQDYHKNIETLESTLEETEKNHQITQEKIVEALNQLPQAPREYRAAVSLTEPTSVAKLRAQIEEDTETLIRLTTQRESLKKKADSLESVKKTLDSIQIEKKTQGSNAESIRKQITETERETGISSSDEEEIRTQHTEANKTLTGLSTQRDNCRRSLERRPQIQENINETSNEINLLTAAVQQEENKLKELEKNGKNLGDEAELNEARDNNNKKSAQLAQEENERTNDITEGDEIIERTSVQREEYPALLMESEREEFSVEAMRRATILLDTTRDNIMSGVKQNVEKNMMQFLPTLTDNRYNMARIDETNYRIEVYDREAKQWRGKGVFSGATQDQFSLALRLAFAISTIPSSRGARPGFIFLDEPLSGFDAQRRSGFMQLLREDLSRHFDQIIVISHIEALAEEFHNTLTLDSGRVIQVQR